MTTMENIWLEPPAADEIVEPMSWFDSSGPFEIEIGCGKGGFLLHRARSYPERRLLGIEWARHYALHCADRVARWNLCNVRIMRTDGQHLMTRNLPPACAHVLHLYHPDPWPKRRHWKRRIVQPAFVEAVARVLVPGGQWRIQTDHAGYFEHMREVLANQTALAEVPWEDDAIQIAQGWEGTNFEVKYVREGRAIHRMACVRKVETS